MYNFEPKIIYGYTSSIKVLAERMRQLGVKYQAKAVITMGSKLLTSSRKLIEERFKSKVFDGYGCGGEGLNIALQCELGSYHVNDELVILEVEHGEAIVTSLHHYAMPLIRYKPGDFVTLGESCKCGRSSMVIKTVSGRSHEVIRTKSGRILVVEFIISAFEFIDGLDQYKVIQDNLSGITINLVVNKHYKRKPAEKSIRDFINKAAGRNFKIKFEYLSKINPEKSGKFNIIESRIK